MNFQSEELFVVNNITNARYKIISHSVDIQGDFIYRTRHVKLTLIDDSGITYFAEYDSYSKHPPLFIIFNSKDEKVGEI